MMTIPQLFPYHEAKNFFKILGRGNKSIHNKIYILMRVMDIIFHRYKCYLVIYYVFLSLKCLVRVAAPAPTFFG